MPLVKYLCSDGQCGKFFTKLYRLSLDIKEETPCKICGKKARRNLSSPASSSTMKIDNGVQARAVEIDPNIMEINGERANKLTDRGD